MQETSKIIEALVNSTEITNKWLMWAELELPEQCVYVPSIFQMRDAYAHCNQIFAYGLEHNLFDSEGGSCRLFEAAETKAQLYETLGHVARAFFDCADYIILKIEDIINHEDQIHKKHYYGIHVHEYKQLVTKLRKAKSESHHATYHNIMEWDKVLQEITTIYKFSCMVNSSENIVSETLAGIQNIIAETERTHDTETIKNHMEDFYKIKVEMQTITIKTKEAYRKELKSAIDDRGTVEDISGWQSNAICELQRIETDLERKYSKLKIAKAAMDSTLEIQKGKGLIRDLKAKYANIAVSILNMLITYIIGGWLHPLIQSVAASGGMPQSGTSFWSVVVYVLIFLLLTVITYSAIALIKWFHKK